MHALEQLNNLFRSATLEYSEGKFGKVLDTLAPLLHSSEAHPEVLNLAAVCLRRLNRYDEAERYLRSVIAAHPAHVDARCNLGNLLRDRHRIAEAEIEYGQALAIRPDHCKTLENLALLLEHDNRLAGAETILQQCLAIDSTNARIWNRLGDAQNTLGKCAEAEHAYRQADAIDPDNAKVLCDRGILFNQLHRTTEAKAAFERALRLSPDDLRGQIGLAVALHMSRQLIPAEAAYRKILERDPEESTALNNLSAILLDAGLLDEGMSLSERAVASAPDAALTHASLAYTLNFLSEDPQTVLHECRRWAQQHENPLLGQHRPHGNNRDPGRRLRIGYVSPDFSGHCQSLFMVPVLSNHDHDRFEIWCYSSVATPDAMTQRLADYVDVWRPVRQLSDERLAEQIREDQIDILVDLTMHMRDGRSTMFARKPAPVQVAWLAYPGTTGMRSIDYRITDPYIDPPGTDDRYAERSVRLPDTFWCYNPQSREKVQPLPALSAGHVTLGSLNNPCKLSDRTLRMWAGVMERVENARLLLLSRTLPPHDGLIGRLRSNGIDLRRVDFVPHQGRESYLQTYNRIDIALDTFPYNGHTTSLDALWMGVPVVTRAGPTVVGRAGLSLLSNLDLTGFVAHSDEAFVDIAVDLANDLPRLAQLRTTLRARMEMSPLMDGVRFTRNLEAAYRAMWREWCSIGDNDRV